MAHIRVLFSGLSVAQTEEIRRQVPEMEAISARPGEMPEQVEDLDALVGLCTQELLRLGKKLRWVQVFDAGVEQYRFPELLNSDIVLTNTKIIQAPEVADHAIALLLALTRNIYQAIQTKEVWNTGESWEWPFPDTRPIELHSKTAVVVGLGGIGIQIAERAASFGMTVLGVDPRDVPYTHAIRQAFKPDHLEELLPVADVLFIAAPLTRETDGMLGEKQLGRMKPDAVLINVSRGKLIRTEALVHHLRTRGLRGVGLDVTDPEPLSKDHALWSFKNVLITPHLAGQSDRNRARRFELVKENVRRFARGLPLYNIVDKAKGY